MFDGKQRILIVLAALAAVAAILATQSTTTEPMEPGAADAALTETMRDVAKRWPDIAHVPTKTVADKLGSDDIVVFDSRSKEEFAVSHLPGAIHVLPDVTRQAFLAEHGDKSDGKLAVFYCSVGVRSSTLATRVASDLKANGATEVGDMAGGIFAWHNEKRPLVNAGGATDSVHSYDEWWGRLVKRQEQIKNTPAEAN